MTVLRPSAGKLFQTVVHKFLETHRARVEGRIEFLWHRARMFSSYPETTGSAPGCTGPRGAATPARHRYWCWDTAWARCARCGWTPTPNASQRPATPGLHCTTP